MAARGGVGVGETGEGWLADRWTRRREVVCGAGNSEAAETMERPRRHGEGGAVLIPRRSLTMVSVGAGVWTKSTKLFGERSVGDR